MFFESLAECSLSFTYVCVAAVDVKRDVIDGSTLVFFGCFVFIGCTIIERRVFAGLWYMCIIIIGVCYVTYKSG